MGCPVVGVPDSQEPQSGTLCNRTDTRSHIIRGIHDLPVVYGVGTRTAEKIGQPRNLNRKALGYLGSRGLSGF